MFRCSSEPHPVVADGLVSLVTEDAHNLISNVDRQTPEHKTGFRRERGKRLENESVRDRLSRLESERIDLHSAALRHERTIRQSNPVVTPALTPGFFCTTPLAAPES